MFAAAAVALAAALLPELILRSREVSEIPLFALLVMLSSAAVARGTWSSDRTTRVVIAVSQALVLWTYYLGVFVILGQFATVAFLKKLDKALLRASLAGVAAGSPALALAAVTAWRDFGAREAARRMPELAWGEHGATEMARALWNAAFSGLGLLLVLFLAAFVLAAIRRRAAALVCGSAAVATACGIALLAPFARMQPYYVSAVIPACSRAFAASRRCARSR